MKPQTFQRLRSLHRWAGLFFAPLIILFAISGMLQVLGAGDWEMPGWMYSIYDALEDAHQNQYFRKDTALRDVAQWLAVLLCLVLSLTSLLGVVMAYKMFPKKRILITIVLVLGVAVPAVLLLV